MTGILIVEDNLVAALELEEILKEKGYQVVSVAESGTEALAMAEAFAPDLVLMDIKLSGEMDGITAAQKIKSKMDIPLIFLTGHSDVEIVKRVGMVRSQGFVLKPYYGAQIRAAIEIALMNYKRDNGPPSLR
jgi:two-component system, response regulator PdtaR